MTQLDLLAKSVPGPGDVIVVWFSCGVASAIAAKKTIERYGDICTIRIVNNPIKEEHPDNRRFLRDVEKWLGIEIELITSSKYYEASAEAVWEDLGVMSFPHGAPCTTELKRLAQREWETANHHDFLVMGFTVDESDRAESFQFTERANLLRALEAENLTKEDCHAQIYAAGIAPPFIYSLGFPNGNCIGCPKATSPTYWNAVRQHFPEVFDRRAELSRRLGARLVRVKGVRIFLDELDPLAKGRPLKSMPAPECGIFCEEYTAGVASTKPAPKPNGGPNSANTEN
jgi:hypothetical protein